MDGGIYRDPAAHGILLWSDGPQRRVHAGKYPGDRFLRAFKGAVAVLTSRGCQHGDLSDPRISAGADLKKAPYRKRKLCGVYLYPSDVDELPFKNHGVADPA